MSADTFSNKTKAKFSSTPWQAFLIVAVLGWINGLASLWHRQKINSLAMDSSSFCNISETVNCDTVALSPYSQIAGIPTASWGMLYYAVVIFIACWAYFKRSDGDQAAASSGAGWLLLISIVSLVPTLALAGISFFVIKSLCLMCLGTYIANILLTVIAYKLYRDNGGHGLDLPPMLKGLGQAGWIIAIILLALHIFSPVIVGRMATGGPAVDDRLVGYAVQSYSIAKVQNFTLAGYPSFGPENAPVTVVEFSDFQCPFCARSSVSVPPLIKSYGDRVRYVYKPYPLDSACNPKMQRSVHALACLAAKAGQCVFDKKGGPAFFDFKKQVFDHQPSLSAESIKGYANDAGLGGAELDACIADPQVHQKIVDAVNEGSTNGVEGTPTIFVNGRKVEMGPQPKALRAVLDHAVSAR